MFTIVLHNDQLLIHGTNFKIEEKRAYVEIAQEKHWASLRGPLVKHFADKVHCGKM